MGEDCDVRIRCGDCALCSSTQRAQTNMCTAQRRGRNKQDSDYLDMVITNGIRKGESQTCPAWQVTRLGEGDSLESPETEKAAPVKLEPMTNPFSNFGYGLACRECRATIGEGHSDGCSYEGIEAKPLGDGQFKIFRVRSGVTEEVPITMVRA